MSDNEYKPNEMMSPAFPVEELGYDFDPDIPPSTAQEYLKQVMFEASNCEEVTVAEIDQFKIKPQNTVEVLPGCQQAPKDLVPSEKWQLCQVSDFSFLRNHLLRKTKNEREFPEVRIPGLRDEKGWRKVCLGSEEVNDGNFVKSPPLLSILFCPNMTQPILLQVLEYNVMWLEDGFTDHQAKWLYALLACLETPLYPETCSLLRELARECARIRLELPPTKLSLVTPLNLLICLVSKYFRQLDLSD